MKSGASNAKQAWEEIRRRHLRSARMALGAFLLFVSLLIAVFFIPTSKFGGSRVNPLVILWTAGLCLSLVALISALAMEPGANRCPHCGKRLLGLWNQPDIADYRALKFCPHCGLDVKDYIEIVFRKS